MLRDARLYHFFPGRPTVGAVDDVEVICSVTNEPRRCSVIVTQGARSRLPLASSGPSGLGRRLREAPIVARARSVGCLCAAEAAVVEVAGRLAGTSLDDLLATVDLVESRLLLAPIWLELRTVLLPGQTDADRHVDLVTKTLFDRLGPDIPLHMTTVGSLDDDERRAMLQHARWIAVANGLRWVYTDDATDPSARCTWCPGCDALLLDHREPVSRVVGLGDGQCIHCGWLVPGHFARDALAA